MQFAHIEAKSAMPNNCTPQTMTKLNKKQVNAKLNEVANTKNAKRDESTLLPLNRAGEVYEVNAVALDSDTVANCEGKLAEVVTGTKVTRCCVSTGAKGGKGKVFYQLNNVEVWLETKDLRDLFGVAAEKEPKSSEGSHKKSFDKRVLELLKSKPQITYATACEIITKADAEVAEDVARAKQAASAKRNLLRLGYSEEVVEKMLQASK